ncbi:MAG: fumarylacetoacetate hydrolase family protein [Desulfovibrio sp.]|jgi:2-keto-4-pentenoate hydratase/2-oxohepta-3-ene-1,7-dioic acid hydratase in catechol pathway|nr:fumarylacetoacetate hydrolase family protein [Desulfovibrio sp.]
MRFVTYRQKDIQTIGMLTSVDADCLIPLREAEKRLTGRDSLPDCMRLFIERGKPALDVARAILEEKEAPNIPLASVTLLAPIPRPAKNIFCVGRNYIEHVTEVNASSPVPEHPIIFSKPPTSVIGPEAPVDAHEDMVSGLDYEGELAVIMGRRACKISEETAFDHIFGYTILNDVTARDLQKRHVQWLLGKGLDTFCPMGPAIVHKSLIPDPTEMRVRTGINGELRQDARVNELIFSIPALLAAITQGITLEPGDIIATGTPSGVGAGFKPPKFLKKGDVMEVSITGLGVLRNHIA